MMLILFQAFGVYLASATHSLQYLYTGATPGTAFAEFTAVGLVDGEQFVYYDSKINKMIPKTEWIQENQDENYWRWQSQTMEATHEIFKMNLHTAKERFNNTKGVHTLQVMVGCELDGDGTKRGYDQFGYDGEDFLSLDMNTLTWTAPKPQAVITKHKWDATGENAHQEKNYLENTCIEWLWKYVSYGRDTLERKVPPKVALFQKDSSSPVVCHATGFFPRRVEISWQKNGEDLHEDVELRETLPNQDGTFQKRSILTVSPEELDRNEYTCVVQHSGLEKDLVLRVTKHRVLNTCRRLRGVSGGVSFAVIVGVVVSVLLVLIRKKKKKKNDIQTFKPVPLMEKDHPPAPNDQTPSY